MARRRDLLLGTRPGRAWQWAEERYPGEEAVVAVEIRLGRCLDLANTQYTSLLLDTYRDIKQRYDEEGTDLPRNTGGIDKKARRLDCLVLNRLMADLDRNGRMVFQTIRCPFEEGEAAFPNGNIRVQSHVQIAVRDLNCLSPVIHLIPKGGVR